MFPYLVGEDQARLSELSRLSKLNSHLCAQGEPVDRTLIWMRLVSSDLRASKILSRYRLNHILIQKDWQVASFST
jgi:hypothetical protein